MRYLITGGAGFIGSHLSDALAQAGHSVTVVDNLSTGRRENLARLENTPGFAFIEADLTVMDAAEIDALAREHDVICHLAAAVGVELVVHDPVHTIYTNVRATEKILEAAARHGTRIVIASTSEVYGKSTREEFSENDDLLIGSPYHSRWSYACSKLLDEFYLMAYCSKRGLPGTAVRFFNTVGPRQSGRYGMVIPRMVANALANRPIEVYGDGCQSRCFCHVADTVRALQGLFAAPEAVGRIYNIGSSRLITIGELAQLIRERLGSSSEIRHIPYDQAYAAGFEDMRRRKPDTGAIRELLGWQPEHSLEEIIDAVAAEYRNS